MPALLPGLFADASTDRSQGASIGKISEAARTPCLVGGSFPPNGEESKNGKPANHVDLKKHCETLTPFLLRPSRCASPKKNNPDLQRSLESFSFDFSASAQTNPTGDGVNASRKFSLKKLKTAFEASRWRFGRQCVGRSFPAGSLFFPPLLSLPLLSLFPLFFLFTPLSLFSPRCAPGAG